MFDDKKATATIIMKRMRGADYDHMKQENVEMKHIARKDGAEQEDYAGLDAAAEDMMQAVQSNNVPAFRTALEDFLEMIEQRPREERE